MLRLLGFDPDSHWRRVQSEGWAIPLSARGSILAGSFGFALVSFAGFAPWAFAGRALHQSAGETGLYLACLIGFLAVSGPAFQALIIGRKNLGRAYASFGLAFLAYAIVWTVIWFGLAKTVKGHASEWVASVLGTGAMTWVLVALFHARTAYAAIWMALFIGHSAGYFLGGALYDYSHTQSAANLLKGLETSQIALFGRIAWGIAYGLGFGAGIGYAYYAAQTEIRQRLADGAAKK